MPPCSWEAEASREKLGMLEFWPQGSKDVKGNQLRNEGTSKLNINRFIHTYINTYIYTPLSVMADKGRVLHI